jgi:hypothetical protein
MGGRSVSDKSAKVAAGDTPAGGGDTRRRFIERLASTAAVPMILPLVLSRPRSAALAY